MKITLILFPAVLALALSACAKTGEIDDATNELAIGAVSGAANAGSAGSQMLISGIASASCPYPATGVAGQNCTVDGTGRKMTLKYDECVFGTHSAVWDGAQTLTSSAAVACGTFPSE